MQAVSVIVRKKPFCSYVVVYSLYAVGKLSEHLNTATFMSNDYFYNQLKGKQNCFEDKIKRLSFIKKKKILCFDVQIQPPSWPTKPPQV